MAETSSSRFLSRIGEGDPGIVPPASDRPLTPGEQDQVDQAVRAINGILLRKNLEIAVELRRYVLDEFFAGSWQAWYDARPGTCVAYDALVARGDLRVGKESLRELMRVGEQVWKWSEDLAYSLSVAHHRALLPVADDTVQQSLAKQAVEEGLTAKQLAERVQQLHPRSPRTRGRPVQPLAYKKLGLTFTASRGVDAARVAQEVAHYTEHQRKVVVERAKALRELAEAVLKVLG